MLQYIESFITGFTQVDYPNRSTHSTAEIVATQSDVFLIFDIFTSGAMVCPIVTYLAAKVYEKLCQASRFMGLGVPTKISRVQVCCF